MNLSNEVKIQRCAGYHDTQETHEVTGADVDFTGYDGVLFFAYIDKKTATTNKNVLEIEQKDADGNYTGLSGAVAECAVDGQVVAVDVYRPLESQGKILRGVIDIDTASKTGDLYAIKYHGRVKPESFADVVTLVISPEVSA